jgi:hypothetical protein
MSKYTLDELKTQAEEIEDEIADLDAREDVLKAQLEAVNAKIQNRQKPTDFNLWDAYYDREQFGQLPPQKAIPEDLEYINDWARDGEQGFFYKAIVDLRKQFEESDDRVEKFASQYILDFHKTYLCLPSGFIHDEAYDLWFNQNYDQAQRKRLFFGLGQMGFRVKPVFANFQDSDDWAGQPAVQASVIRDMGLIWGGNVNAGGRDYNGITASLASFEKYWDGRRGANRVRKLASNELVIMDRQYKKLGEEGREAYLASHPGYVPVI